MTPQEMEAVQDRHVAAENRQDLDAAVATYHEECYYENVALGIRFEGKQGVALQYAATFNTFPDFEGRIEGRAFGRDLLVEWGRFSGTAKGEFMGLQPTGKRVEVPFCAVITFRDGLMEGEKVFFDLATLCDQAGVSIEEVRAAAKLLAG